MNIALLPRRLNASFDGTKQHRNLRSWASQGFSWASIFESNVLRVMLYILVAKLWNYRTTPREGDVVFSPNRVTLHSIAGKIGLQNRFVQLNASWAVWLTILCIFSWYHGLVGSIALAFGGGNEVIGDETLLPDTTSDTSTIRKFWRHFNSPCFLFSTC